MNKKNFPRRVLAGLCLMALVSAAALYLSPATSGQARAQVRQDLERVLTNYDELTLDPSGVHKQVRQTGRLTLSTSHGTFDLALEPYDLRAANYRAEAWGAGGRVRLIERAPVRTYKGAVRGMEGAQARFTIDDGTIEGVVITTGGLFFVEPASRFSASAAKTDFIFYAESSVRAESFGECGVTLAEEVGAEAARVRASGALAATDGPRPEEVFGPALEVDIATEADFEYFTALGSTIAANSEILSIMNQVDGIYNTQLGLRFRVVFQRVWETNTDPYTLTAAGPALDQLANSYNGSFAPGTAPARDIVHMWTGKDFDGSTIGIAYRPGFGCDPQTSAPYGISQRFTQEPQKFGLTAHEIGHNFGACHPNQTTCASSLPSGCAGTIMNASITPSTTFCQFSRDQITTHTVSNTSCLTRLTSPGCTYSISPATQVFTSAGGAGSVNVTTETGCAWAVAEGVSWFNITGGETGTGNGSASFTVDANTGGPREARADIAGRRLTVAQAASSNCPTTPIGPGTVNGTLTNTDCVSGQADRPNAFIDLYSFSGVAGQQVRIEMSDDPTQAGTLDTFLYLFAPDGTIIAEHDDIVPGQQTNSRIPLSGYLTLPQTGTYVIEATSFDNNQTGAYTLRLTDAAALNNAAFSSSAYNVAEGVQASGVGAEGLGFRTVTVTRSGDTAGAATVDYATSNGTAESRKDYTQALGTLRFAAGETQKSFTILVSDDRFAEVDETVALTLSNPLGTSLGSQSSAVLSIISNDGSNGPSPVKDASLDVQFFVRQHYLDFLNREPDEAGLNFWIDRATNCGQQDLLVCRINVSAAFFLSIENQETGYLTHRAYRVAYGNLPNKPVPLTLREYLAGGRRIGEGVIVGTLGWEAQLEANKVAFFNEFVTTSRFTALYPQGDNGTFVDALNANASGALSASERDALVNALNASAMTRAQALRAVAEDADFAQGPEKNRAFVLAQYFGYLRRDPDDVGFNGQPDPNFEGYNFWLTRLNQFNGNFIQAEMVKAFIQSIEYGERFGQ